MTAMLQIGGLVAGYSASQVLHGIDFEIVDGEMHGLLGRNGMGKTTTIRSIFGQVRAREGTIHFRGEPIHTWSTDRIGRAGIALAPEGRQIFPNLSVEENLIAFFNNRSDSPNPWTLDRVYDFFPCLLERRHNMGNELSGGEQQMLAIGRALMTNPYLLILDEATEGLAPLIREEIWTCLSALHRSGQTILIIDKYIERLISLADRHTILEGGRVAWRGSSAELEADHQIWRQFLGV